MNFGDIYDCTPEGLSGGALATVDTYREPILLALIFVGLAPWAWHFLLRRVAKPRSATGRLPLHRG